MCENFCFSCRLLLDLRAIVSAALKHGGCRSKILGKENILFDLPSPHPILGGGNDTNDVIIAAACAAILNAQTREHA